MATEVVMPRLSDTMESGTVAKWLKREGDQIARGDIIAEIETDKSNMELESYAAGILAQIIVQEGQSAALGQPIAMIAASAEEAQRLRSGPSSESPVNEGAQSTRPEPKQDAAASLAETDPKPAESPPTERPAHTDDSSSPNRATRQQFDADLPRQGSAAPPSEVRQPSQRTKASPLARRVAQENGVTLGDVSGTGPSGRITKEDVLGFLRQTAPVSPTQTQPEAAAVQKEEAPAPSGEGPRASQPVEMTRMQRTIARRMSQSKFSAPEFILTAEFDMTEARVLLKSLSGVEGAPKVGPNDLLIKAVAVALTQHLEVNSGWENETMVRFGRVNVGNAVALPGGLVVPVIPDADKKSLGQIAASSKELIDKARAGKLQPSEYDGGTFTISNLGMYGIDQFTAILDPPESCILAVGAITPKPVVIDGEVMVRDRMRVSMTCDHRVVNGAQGAEFLRTLRGLLEHPLLALL